MNRFIVLCIGLLCFSWNVQAQSSLTTAQEVDQWVALYDMSTAQAYHVRQMVEMKAFNHEELKVLEASEPELYEKKMKNLDRQFQLGVKSLLTEEQLVKYRQLRLQEQERLTQKIEQLKANGAEKIEIAQAIEELKAIQ